jgi:hypothetical protein
LQAGVSGDQIQTLAWDELEASAPPATARLHWFGIAVVRGLVPHDTRQRSREF